MTKIATQERQTYVDMWAHPAYNDVSPGEQLLPLFLDMAHPAPGATALDAGCGAGKGATALASAGLSVSMCDLTDAGLTPEVFGFPFVGGHPLWDKIFEDASFDYVYCCDVLEHIPMPFTMLTVSRLLDVSRHGVFLSISMMPDNFGVLIGKTLHQSVQTFVQWRDQLDTIGVVIEARDLLHTGVYLVERR